MLAGMLDEIKPSIEVENIDIDNERSTAVTYGVRGVPTMVMVDAEGKEVKRLVGVHNKADLEGWLSV